MSPPNPGWSREGEGWRMLVSLIAKIKRITVLVGRGGMEKMIEWVVSNSPTHHPHLGLSGGCFTCQGKQQGRGSEENFMEDVE
ncbi:hypothetical protein C0Q70_08325 [Pomacea canaliculata]|uniref:Uncharacterized protein n=1 Tax=Pomacea canaliculata TaxID=400727 RepID=A0A2T7PHI2_POMCA|nr:hypothetical protein C0Q70_08325 [Pomacea canaliculata]